MANTVFQQSYTFRDVKGQTSTMRFYLSAADAAAAATAGQALGTALAAHSNAALQNARGPYSLPPGPVTYGGTDGSYSEVEDKAELVFATASGSIHRYRLPACNKGLFLADLETVDPNGGVGAIITAVIGNACSRDGSVVQSFIGGVRTRSPHQRRINLFTKGPDTVAPAL